MYFYHLNTDGCNDYQNINNLSFEATHQKVFSSSKKTNSNYFNDTIPSSLTTTTISSNKTISHITNNEKRNMLREIVILKTYTIHLKITLKLMISVIIIRLI